MAKSQALEVQQKKELVSKEEKIAPARYFMPSTDIYETDDALVVTMEVPGAEKKSVNVKLEGDVLRVDAEIDFTKYEGFEPVYTEYNVGHFERAFSISSKIDQDNIAAELDNGVLTLTLKKTKEAQARRIPLS